MLSFIIIIIVIIIIFIIIIIIIIIRNAQRYNILELYIYFPYVQMECSNKFLVVWTYIVSSAVLEK